MQEKAAAEGDEEGRVEEVEEAKELPKKKRKVGSWEGGCWGWGWGCLVVVWASCWGC